MKAIILLLPALACGLSSIGAAQDGPSPATSQNTQEVAQGTNLCPHGIVAPFPMESDTAGRIEIHYPEQARREKMEGSVGVRVLIGCDGYAKDCQVTRSSGYTILDAAACDDILEHSRIRPQTNAAGQLHEEYLQTELHYNL